MDDSQVKVNFSIQFAPRFVSFCVGDMVFIFNISDVFCCGLLHYWEHKLTIHLFVASERFMLREVEVIKDNIRDLARHQREVNAKLDRLLARETSGPASHELPDGLDLPLASMEAVNNLEERLTDKQFADVLVS